MRHLSNAKNPAGYDEYYKLRHIVDKISMEESTKQKFEACKAFAFYQASLNALGARNNRTTSTEPKQINKSYLLNYKKINHQLIIYFR